MFVLKTKFLVNSSHSQVKITGIVKIFIIHTKYFWTLKKTIRINT